METASSVYEVRVLTDAFCNRVRADLNSLTAEDFEKKGNVA